MVNTSDPWFPGKYDSPGNIARLYVEQRSRERRETIASATRKVVMAANCALFLLPNEATAENQYTQTELLPTTSASLSEAEIQAGQDIGLKIRAASQGILVDGGKYYWLLLEDGFKMRDFEQGKTFMMDFVVILDYLFNRDVLNSSDMINAMNLWEAKKDFGVESRAYADAYDTFAGGYPNPDLNIIEILSDNNYPFHGKI